MAQDPSLPCHGWRGKLPLKTAVLQPRTTSVLEIPNETDDFPGKIDKIEVVPVNADKRAKDIYWKCKYSKDTRTPAQMEEKQRKREAKKEELERKSKRKKKVAAEPPLSPEAASALAIRRLEEEKANKLKLEPQNKATNRVSSGSFSLQEFLNNKQDVGKTNNVIHNFFLDD